MKVYVIVFSIAALACTPTFAKGGSGHSGGSHLSSSHSIKSYTKKDGTHVARSHAKNPNNSKSDNWSAKGNVNPYTGKKGTKDPYTGK